MYEVEGETPGEYDVKATRETNYAPDDAPIGATIVCGTDSNINAVPILHTQQLQCDVAGTQHKSTEKSK